METRIYERETLYKEVWEEPMTSLSKRYGVSDVALRKQCKRMDIPLPKAGHWAKVKAGHKVEIPLLPKSDISDKVVVAVRIGDSIGRKVEDLLLFLPDEQRKNVKQYCLSLTVQEKLKKPHRLIEDTKLHYQSGKETTKPSTDRVFNVNVSNNQRERLYRFYDTLFKALEYLGYEIEIKVPKYRGYYQRNEVVVRLNEVVVPIFMKEKQKRIKHNPTKEELERSFSYGPAYDYIKTGKLHFGIDSYSAKRKNWNDTETRKIEDQIGEIVIWIMEAIHVEFNLVKKHEAVKRHRLEEERVRREIAKSKEEELKRFELLNQSAINWDKANQIRKFAEAAELKFVGLYNEEEKEKLRNWLNWAYEKADWIDPLVESKDNILGDYQSVIDEILK